ncbi:MAG: stage III sporulation protein AB [Clostridia bacterium]|nr:stage III sporulation protein AB [Clostridia bacterium]
MIKIIGSILILCASVCACAFYERAEKAKIASLQECCDFIKHIRAQIEYFSTPVDKIFSSYDKKTELIDALISKDAKNYFEKEDYPVINEFFASVGRQLKDEELSSCSYTISELEKRLEKRRQDYPNKIKVFRAMALFIGISVIILLI